MRVTDAAVRRACYVIDRSDAPRLLEALIRPNPRGRKRRLSARTFLIGAFLTVEHGHDLVFDSIYDTLTKGLPRPWQWELDVLRRSAGRDGGEQVTMLARTHLYDFSKTLRQRLNYTIDTAPELTEQQRRDREEAVMRLADALVEVTLPATTSAARAIDATGIWAWARGRAKGEDLTDVDGDHPAVADEANGAEEASVPYDRDARWGGKTSKDGRMEPFFGYQLHAMGRIPDRRDTDEREPALVERFALTAANADIVAPTLSMLDRARHAGHAIDEIVVDRHYSYKDTSRWGDELRRRGIDQHLDLHATDQGFRDYNGAKLAAGWLHCPATPDRLGTLPLPGPFAGNAEHRAFDQAIEERQRYAMRRIERHRPSDGRARWECPAIAGNVGCPLRQDTVEVAHELGLPVITNPPEAATAPSCCTQRSVSTTADAQLKLAQPHYWGSRKWKQSYARRTYIEGFFGNLKNPSAENVRRGFFRTTGLGPITLLLAIAIAASNVRQLRVWHHATGLGDPDHPLLAAEDPGHGYLELDSEQAAAFDDGYQQADIA